MVIKIKCDHNNIGKAMDLLQSNNINYEKIEKPQIIESMNVHDLSKVEQDILDIYRSNSVCIGEVLASTGVNNISLEDAAELYCKIMHKIEDDNFVQFYDGTKEFKDNNFRFIGE